MREHVIAQICEHRRWSTMFRMTIAAGKIRALVCNRAMQFSHIEHLPGNVRMTGNTPIGHPLAFPGRRMTSLAFLDLSVGRHTAISLAASILIIQSTGCKHFASTCKRDPDYPEDRDQCG
jgi:hypothetical protein